MVHLSREKIDYKEEINKLKLENDQLLNDIDRIRIKNYEYINIKIK